MNILFLTRRFHPYIGGVEKHVMEISKRLIAKGHKITIITESSPDKKIPQYEVVNRIHVYRINVGNSEKNKKFHIWKNLLQHRDLIRDADIVHCHDVFFWYIPFRFIFPQKPVYTTFHGYESYPISKSAIRMRALSERLSWGNICIGDFITKWYGTKPTYVSYGGVDVEKKHNNPSPQKLSALFYGRLDDQTGIETYSDAVKKVNKTFPKFDFLVIGDGPLKKSLSKRTKSLAFQKKPESFFIEYRFAFLSRYLSILEAFAAKRLVFAVYDNPVKQDYLRMTPYSNYMIIEKDYAKLAEKILYFIEHPDEEKQLVEDAYKWVVKQTWSNIVDVYLKLWNIKAS